MKVILTTLFAATESQYVDLSLLRTWADKCIEATQQPDNWLINLSLASSKEIALNALRAALSQYGVVLDEEYGELLLGFWYRRLECDDLRKEMFFVECIDILDAYDVLALDGTEIVNGWISESLINSLKVWAARSEESLRRIFEMRFSVEESERLRIV